MVREDPRSAEILKPVLRGRDIKRYQAQWAGLWLIVSHNGYADVPPVNIGDYPVVKSHLDKYYPELQKRQDKGVTPYNLRNCAYHAEFEREKIIYPNMTKFLPFTFDTTGKFTNQKCFVITGGTYLKYLTAVLNSKVGMKWLLNNCPELQGGTRELSKVFFEHIPIPQINADKQQMFVRLVDEILERKAKNNSTSELEAEIDKRVYDLYDLTNEEIKTVEPA